MLLLAPAAESLCGVRCRRSGCGLANNGCSTAIIILAAAHSGGAKSAARGRGSAALLLLCACGDAVGVRARARASTRAKRRLGMRRAPDRPPAADCMGSNPCMCTFMLLYAVCA